MSLVVNRKTLEERVEKPSLSQRFLYRTLVGRILLKMLIRPWVSKLAGRYMNSRLSKIHIRHFIKKNNIKVEEYELDEIHSFNDFFSRKIKTNLRPIDIDPKVLISPCDAKLSVYPIKEDSIFQIKGSYYRIQDLLEDDSLAKTFENGYCLIFRLGVTDYHRYCYIDDGTEGSSKSILGVFHTVHPISLEKYNFFKTNHRIYTVLHTLNFGDVVAIEVGAMMVGKIHNHRRNLPFTKGEEKGYFLFGGSTIVLLIKNIVQIDSDILKASQEGKEITVCYGERVGILNE